MCLPRRPCAPPGGTQTARSARDADEMKKPTSVCSQEESTALNEHKQMERRLQETLNLRKPVNTPVFCLYLAFTPSSSQPCRRERKFSSSRNDFVKKDIISKAVDSVQVMWLISMV